MGCISLSLWWGFDPPHSALITKLYGILYSMVPPTEAVPVCIDGRGKRERERGGGRRAGDASSSLLGRVGTSGLSDDRWVLLPVSCSLCPVNISWVFGACRYDMQRISSFVSRQCSPNSYLFVKTEMMLCILRSKSLDLLGNFTFGNLGCCGLQIPSSRWVQDLYI